MLADIAQIAVDHELGCDQISHIARRGAAVKPQPHAAAEQRALQQPQYRRLN